MPLLCGSGEEKAAGMTIGLLGFQTTIAAPVSLKGTGVHSGSPSVSRSSLRKRVQA